MSVRPQVEKNARIARKSRVGSPGRLCGAPDSPATWPPILKRSGATLGLLPVGGAERFGAEADRRLHSMLAGKTVFTEEAKRRLEHALADGAGDVLGLTAGQQ